MHRYIWHTTVNHFCSRARNIHQPRDDIATLVDIFIAPKTTETERQQKLKDSSKPYSDWLNI